MRIFHNIYTKLLCGFKFTFVFILSASFVFMPGGFVSAPNNAEAGNVIVVREPVSSSFSATGGTITTSGAYTIHTFNSSGTFTPNGSGNVEVL
ncbi:MAG: hypothetical protein COV57_01980, partial [Candidatus Liptonbacteria bacterium CG11_big_fil_rev_8_21_14_0_20_35_14]